MCCQAMIWQMIGGEYWFWVNEKEKEKEKPRLQSP